MLNLEDRFNDYIHRQKVYDIGITYLASLSSRKVNVSGFCQYGGGIVPCVVGFFFADHEYRPEMEGLRFRRLVDDGLAPPRLRPHTKILTKLQCLHDDINGWRDRSRQHQKDRARTVARKNGVDSAIIDTVTWVDLVIVGSSIIRSS